MEVEQEFGDQVDFISVPGLSDDTDAMQDFMDATGAGALTTISNGNALWVEFDVNSQGTYVFLNQDGSWTSVRRPPSLSEHLTELIAS